MTIDHDEPLDLGASTSAMSVPTSGRGPGIRGATVRWALVQRVRLQIAAGVYATPQRWAATLDRVARAFSD